MPVPRIKLAQPIEIEAARGDRAFDETAAQRMRQGDGRRVPACSDRPASPKCNNRSLRRLPRQIEGTRGPIFDLSLSCSSPFGGAQHHSRATRVHWRGLGERAHQWYDTAVGIARSTRAPRRAPTGGESLLPHARCAPPVEVCARLQARARPARASWDLANNPVFRTSAESACEMPPSSRPSVSRRGHESVDISQLLLPEAPTRCSVICCRHPVAYRPR